MLTVYVLRGTALEPRILEGEKGLPAGLPEAAIWLDLLNPTLEEDRLVEKLVGAAIPTREEMQEIEISSRLYIENGARYMTATLMSQSDTPSPVTTPVSFILAGQRLVTVRYDEPRPFAMTRHKLGRACPSNVTGQTVLMDLLDAVIDRNADILERIGMEVDQVSQKVFETRRSRGGSSRVYQGILYTIGRKGDLTSKVRESLVSIGRLVLFLAQEGEDMRWSKEMRAQLKTMQRDTQSLSDHTTYLTNSITFLLDAMLGLVSIEQNNIIKLFSVVAVVMMPPTLVASIYGMNFEFMPELKWAAGYPLALIAMVISSVVPYLYFKWKKWL
ncbi:magnesium transporter CorA family protein [Pseudorhodoplanes sinuspersici]|uniref:Magnesium transport protein CorA n=1 Tax=Pseudorhodoplanes sinuspersici TaxID=1235591 RepID=A0A1W6ZTE4_9HYPH|nr:magnesium transporter CorA family protein [Pseudorhodoplanes sinuspersici]ARQ00381.1 magnesium transporter [Pseudorhodoplanes sinuspersici]RKE67455.1 magnesium transporter [Pseudorhodoplanes sinuspersici]